LISMLQIQIQRETGIAIGWLYAGRSIKVLLAPRLRFCQRRSGFGSGASRSLLASFGGGSGGSTAAAAAAAAASTAAVVSPSATTAATAATAATAGTYTRTRPSSASERARFQRAAA
jgi:hypothetical protein